jgi:hypothetical protein
MRRLTILGLLLTLGGCSYQLWLRIDGELEGPRMAITAPWIMQPTTCLDRLWVVKASDPQDRLWDVVARNGACAPGSEITYGHAPTDFEPRTSARQLEPGILYEAFASSKGAGGSIQFIYLNDGWKVVTGR